MKKVIEYCLIAIGMFSLTVTGIYAQTDLGQNQTKPNDRNYKIKGGTQIKWKAVTSNNETSVYIDPDSIKRSNGLIKVSQLMSFSQKSTSPDGKITYQSSITTEEYDCNKKLSRTLGFKWFSDVNGGGNTVYQDKHNYDFTRLVDGSLLDAVRKNICQI